MIFPGVAPYFALGVPNSRVGLRLPVFDSCNIILAVMCHVHFKIRKYLLVWVFEVFKQFFSETKLQIKPILVSDLLKLTHQQVFVIWDSQIDPFVFMSPCCHVRQYLWLSNPSFAPEKHTCVVSFKPVKRSASQFLRAPVVVAELMVALPINPLYQDKLLTYTVCMKLPQPITTHGDCVDLTYSTRAWESALLRKSQQKSWFHGCPGQP